MSQPVSKYIDAETDDLAYNTCVRPPIWSPEDNDAAMTATVGRQQPYRQAGNVDIDIRTLPRNANGL